MKKFNRTKFNKLVNTMGRLYGELVMTIKSEDCPIAPNDHLVGVIGEWRAVEIIKSTMALEAFRSSNSATSPDDIHVVYKGKEHHISVKTTTEHSKTGLAGLFKCGPRARWEWMLCVRLTHDLSYKEHFWVKRTDAEKKFKHVDGRSKQFKWAWAQQLPRYSYPDWYKSKGLKRAS